MSFYAMLAVAAFFFALSIGMQLRADRKGPVKPPILNAPSWVPWVLLGVLWLMFGAVAVVADSTEARVTMLGLGGLMTVMTLYGKWRTGRLRRQT